MEPIDWYISATLNLSLGLSRFLELPLASKFLKQLQNYPNVFVVTDLNIIACFYYTRNSYTANTEHLWVPETEFGELFCRMGQAAHSLLQMLALFLDLN